MQWPYLHLNCDYNWSVLTEECDSVSSKKMSTNFFRWAYCLLTKTVQHRKSHLSEYAHLSFSFGHTAQWLYRKNVKWFGTRSFPDTRKSTGYQYWNSWRSFLREKKFKSDLGLAGSWRITLIKTTACKIFVQKTDWNDAGCIRYK